MTPLVFGGFAGLSIGGAIALARRSFPGSGATRRPGGWRRGPIRPRVRRRVWQRDRGACVVCGTRDQVRFEHIIPLSRGGSSTVRNLELRCGTCRRLKDDSTPSAGRSPSALAGASDVSGLDTRGGG
jgi:HNH endonuclease